MHDPMTVAFEIKSPIKRRDYRETLVTFWHVDPEKDGTDDSCGWFMRSRHGDKAVLEAIRKEFAYDWDSEHGGWFHPASGDPRLSVSGVVLNMFFAASHIYYGRNREKSLAFMQRNLAEILLFAENNVDSLFNSVTMRYRPEKREYRIDQFAHTVYGWILRNERPWWRHPRFHLHHMRIQIHPIQKFKRWAFSRCAACGKGFSWGYSPTSYGWGGDGPRWFKGERGTYHSDCLPNEMKVAQ